MNAAVFFSSSCPKCRHQQAQRGFSRPALLRLLSAGHPVEAYCAPCDEFWAISPRERAALAGELNGRSGADSSPQEQGERAS